MEFIDKMRCRVDDKIYANEKENVIQRWNRLVLWTTLVILVLVSLVVAYVDPFFHYHAPIDNISYPIWKQRYQNDGIMRHWSYDAIISGTSMVGNFKSTDVDREFDVTSVKVPYYGAYQKELNDALTRAYETNNEIKIVIRSMDYFTFEEDKNAENQEYEFPVYLTNDNPFDDVNYLLNKEVLYDYVMRTVLHTVKGGETTSFDEYSNQNLEIVEKTTYDGSFIYDSYDLKEPFEEVPFTEEDAARITENITENVIPLIRQHPETTWYIFVPPYSICEWDCYYQDGVVNWMLDAEELAFELLLDYENVRLFSFNTREDIICDLDNYVNRTHYNVWVSSELVRCMSQGICQVTKENYGQVVEAERQMFLNYDYEELRLKRANK